MATSRPRGSRGDNCSPWLRWRSPRRGWRGVATPEEDVDKPVGLTGGTNLWDIPDAAWRRAIGSHPPGATGTVSPLGTNAKPTSRTKRGIPVGGIGTGSFMLNLSGSFGPWHFDIGGDDSVGSRWGSPRNSGLEDRYLSQAAFHVSMTTAAGTCDDSARHRGPASGVVAARDGRRGLCGAVSQGVVRLRESAASRGAQAVDAVRGARRPSYIAARGALSIGGVQSDERPRIRGVHVQFPERAVPASHRHLRLHPPGSRLLDGPRGEDDRGPPPGRGRRERPRDPAHRVGHRGERAYGIDLERDRGLGRRRRRKRSARRVQEGAPSRRGARPSAHGPRRSGVRVVLARPR